MAEDARPSRPDRGGDDPVERVEPPARRRAQSLTTVPAGGGSAVAAAPQPKRIQQKLTVTVHSPGRPSLVSYQDDESLPPFPAPGGRRYGLYISFVLFVVVPIVLAGVYFNSYASKQYLSEFRFSVKDTSSPSNPNVDGLLTAAGIGNSVGTENYLVTEYLTSRQAVEDLQARIHVIDLYSRPGIDWWSRYDAAQPLERFVGYWQKMVSARYDQVTGIASVQVYAFAPQDALLITDTMVKLSEDLINRIARRTQNDAVRFAEIEVTKAQERLTQVRAQLAGRRKPNSTNEGETNLLLDFDRQTAQNMLATAMQSLDRARASAAAQHLYITPFVRPSLPHSPTYPRPVLATALFGLFAFSAWLIGLFLVRSIFERFS
jgi:capsule polysaccharide export protein KpsE/RkpR